MGFDRGRPLIGVHLLVGRLRARQGRGRLSPLARFLAVYGALFAAFGVASPFLPGLLQQDGLAPGAIGLVLAGGTAIRLLAGPLGGRLADKTGRPSTILALATAASALVAISYAGARGLPLLLLISVIHAAVLAPITPLADALALGSAGRASRFRYGWVRGAGSAAFIVGALASGQLVGAHGLGVIIWLNAALLGVAACLAPTLPNRMAGLSPDRGHAVKAGSVWALLRVPGFALIMIVVSLIGGSHALHDGFEVIRWRSAGMPPGKASVLWSLSVAAEIVVFAVFGAPLLRWLGTRGALILAALAGIIRWSTAAMTAWFPLMAIVEPLHGLTFALLHLACMAFIGHAVPSRLAATAQAFYATVAMGATSTLVTLASGSLYGHFGATAFWAMSAMCAIALPLAVFIKLPHQRRLAL